MNPTAGARRAAQTLTDEAVAGIAEAYERGLTLDALKLAETLGPLRNWRGAWPCALASRIATNAGAPRLGMRLGVRAYQSDRGHNEALSQYGLQIMSTRGPLALWNMLRDFRPDCGAASASWELTAEILGLKGRAAADLRDFATAERLLRDAESYNPGRAWVRLQRAYLLERLDRVEEGLEVARAACALHPHPYYRPGVQTCAHLLQLLDRDDDAIALLQQACATLQNAPVAAQLYALLSENRRWAEAEAALERFAHLAPLVEPAGLKWLASERARVAYQRGRRAEAAAFLAGIEDSFYQRFAEKLAEPPPPDERLQLDVTFVRQHFKTCAPATLAAIGQFWKMPADHLKVAEAICYDGTPSWQQRDWAERNGWHVREFRATSESTLALLARRIPFAITVVGATSAHMMAVTGFDRTRGALLLRDPSQPYVIEWKIDDFFERFQAFGPHAMVFVPAAERDRIADLDLPDAALYDEYHRMLLALSKHDRAQAARQLINLARLGKDTALVWEARFDLANYDANTVEQARCLDRVLERFPNTTSRLLQRLECMGEAPREERLRFLERACSVSKADPALFVALARELLGDARRAEECGRWLARARRARPMDSEVIRVQGHLHWQAGRFDEAVEHLRFASCLEGFREHLYRAWFVACRQTRRTQDALDHLEDRYQRFGQKSEQPAVTLAWALIEVDQPQRARKTLQEAIQLRPSDGTLLVRAATLIAGLGEPADATKLLSAAKGVTRENDWLRSRIEVAEKTLDFEAALATGRELLKLEPNALDAHAAIARALARREGMPAARKAIDQACAASPHHCGLRRMRVEWSRRSEPEEMVTAARELLRLEPADAWAHRELAVALSRLNRNDEALREAEEAARIEPSSSYSASTLGLVYRRLGKVSESRRQHRAAITASVDNNYSIGELLELARNDVERRADITFVEQELLRQAVMGDGLLAYLEIARPVLDAEPLLALLRRAHAERPDLWHAWSALVSQLVHVLKLDEALVVAKQATERFPHLSRTWLDLATVHQHRGVLQDEIAALERACDIDPTLTTSARALAAAYERGGQMDQARAAYERAMRHSAFDGMLHAAYASLLWRQRLPQEACASVEQALRLTPGLPFAWAQLSDWSAQSGDPTRVVQFARALSSERGGEPEVWLSLARYLPTTQMAEALAAVERALQLDRQSIDAWDLKATLLAVAERFDEAVKACMEGMAACAADVHLLAGRRAWVEAQRRQMPEAIRQIKEVLANNQGYAWGWHELVSWLLHTEATAEALDALDRMRKIWPHDPAVNRKRAFLLLRQGNKPAAKEAFAAVLAASPTDVSAAHNLLDLQLEASDMQGARATLDAMQTHQPGAPTLAVEIRLHLHARNVDAACAALERLCASRDPDAWPMDSACELFRHAQASDRALRIIERALRLPDVHPHAGAAIVRLLAARMMFVRATRFFLKLPPGELRRHAALPLVQAFAENKCRLLLRLVLWRRSEALRADDLAWGQVGYALVNVKRMQKAVDWLSDWRARPNVQSWMLFNYCLALRYLGRYEEANDVAEHVIQTWGHREGSGDMHLFLAIERALVGATRAAQEHLQRASVRSNVRYDQQMLALTKALVEFHSTPPAQRRGRFAAIKGALSEQFAAPTLVKSMRDVRRTFWRAAEVFRRDGAGFDAWLWSRWKLHWQWSLLLTIPAIGAVGLALGVAMVHGLSPGIIILVAVLSFLRRSQR